MTPYTMGVHVQNCHQYVATRRKKEGRSYMSKPHWGTIKDGVFIPNSGFLLLPRE